MELRGEQVNDVLLYEGRNVYVIRPSPCRRRETVRRNRSSANGSEPTRHPEIGSRRWRARISGFRARPADTSCECVQAQYQTDGTEHLPEQDCVLREGLMAGGPLVSRRGPRMAIRRGGFR